MAFGEGLETGLFGLLALKERARAKRAKAEARGQPLPTVLLPGDWDAFYQALEERGVEELGADPYTAASSLGTIGSPLGLNRYTGTPYQSVDGTPPFDLMRRQPSFFGGSLAGLRQAAGQTRRPPRATTKAEASDEDAARGLEPPRRLRRY